MIEGLTLKDQEYELEGLEVDANLSRLNKSLEDIHIAAYNKWGSNKIPYAHQRNEGYNCVGFVDDIIAFAVTGERSQRIKQVHLKYKLIC